MADQTKIEWTDATWNPVRARSAASGDVGWHCHKVSAGCDNCYAASFNHRLGNRVPFKPGHLRNGDVEMFLDEKMLTQPLRWKKPRMIFVCSMTDLFADFVPDAWIDKLFAVMALCPQHTFQVLTKRPERMQRYLTKLFVEVDAWDRIDMQAVALGASDDEAIAAGNLFDKPLPNVWLGTSVEDQATANERVPHLLDTPAAVRFLSAEPLLAPISFRWTPWVDWSATAAAHGSVTEYDGLRDIDWIIAGGESGTGARPMHPDWVRTIRDQCAAAKVPFFFKQWGSWLPWEPDGAPDWRSQNGQIVDGHFLFPADMDGSAQWDDGLTYIEDSGHAAFQRVDKKHAGRWIDGATHDGMPDGIEREGGT